MELTSTMQSIDILIKEHELIRRVLIRLDQARGLLEKGGQPPAAIFEKMVQFAREFADSHHHFKEEFLLFGLLADRKRGEMDYEIGVLRVQHDVGRKSIAQIADQIEKYKQLDELAISMLLQHLTVYISLLNRHIAKEDALFFPMAAGIMTPEDDQDLMHHFEVQYNAPAYKTIYQNACQTAADIEALVNAL